MMGGEPVIGFIGFGEVAYELSKGLRKEYAEGIIAYDKCSNNGSLYARTLKNRAQEVGVELFLTMEELVKQSDLLISAVTVRAALDVAREATHFLARGKLYVDVNSCSPSTKEEIARTIEDTGAKFVGAALLGSVSMHGYRVPIFVSGDGAEEFQRIMSNYGMNIRVVSRKAADAAAVKMLRSIYMKGIEALLLETLVAAHRYRIMEPVFETIIQSMDRTDFATTINMLLTTNAVHSKRRADEMEEVIKTLKDIDIEPIMSEATRELLVWSASLNLREHFKGKMPDSYKLVLEAIDRRR